MLVKQILYYRVEADTKIEAIEKARFLVASDHHPSDAEDPIYEELDCKLDI